MSTLDLFAPAPTPARPAKPASRPVQLTNANGAMRCRAPGCAADAPFAFGTSPHHGVWTCARHQDFGWEALRERA